MSSNVFPRLAALASAGMLVAVSAGPALAQSGDPAAGPAAATAPKAGVKRVAIAKSVFGDAGMIVNARNDGYIEVAAAGSKKTVLLQLRTLAARAWADSALRVLKARPRRSQTPRSYRVDIEEHGAPNTMALTRKVTAGESEYSLFFSDDPLAGFTIPIEKSEADVFVAQIRRAVAQSAKMLERPDSAAKRADSVAPKKPKPAARRPAKPPAAAPAKPTTPS